MIERIVQAGFARRVSGEADWMQLGLARLVHDLLVRTAISEQRQRGHHFINIPSSHWGALLGEDRYTQVIRKAKEIGLVESNDRYSVGRFSKSFRLSDKCRGVALELFADRKARNAERFWNLEAIGNWLASQLKRFDIEATPDMAKPWDAISILIIRSGGHYATRCDFGNRFHSIFTATSRGLRPFLRVRRSNEELAMIDIANSQPLILGIDALEHGYQCTRWIGLGSEGRIYEELAKKMKTSRDEVKAQLLPVMFDRVERMERYEIFRILNSDFPEITEYMVEAKRLDHKTLAKNCQQLESKIFIEGVCGKLFKGGFDLPILTIHDAAITTQEGASEVAKQIRAKFEEKGTGVRLHRENLTKNRRRRERAHEEEEVRRGASRQANGLHLHMYWVEDQKGVAD